MGKELCSVLQQLFPGEPEHKLAARELAMRIQSHRMRKFGWEKQVNHYSANELRHLAFHMPPFQCKILLMEAERRG